MDITTHWNRQGSKIGVWDIFIPYELGVCGCVAPNIFGACQFLLLPVSCPDSLEEFLRPVSCPGLTGGDFFFVESEVLGTKMLSELY